MTASVPTTRTISQSTFAIRKDVLGFWRNGPRQIYTLASELNRNSQPLSYRYILTLFLFQLVGAVTIFYAMKQGKLVGMITLVKAPFLSFGNLLVGDFIVSKESGCRGMGIGSELLDTALGWVDEQERFDFCVLVNNSGNPEREIAAKMYIKRGFEVKAARGDIAEGTDFYVRLRRAR